MIETQETVRVGIDEATNRVYMEVPSKVMGMPWQAAELIAKTLLAKAAQCKQVEMHAQIIEDGAILHKAGVNIGLSDMPKMKEEIKKEAQWGIGRKVPGVASVRSSEVVGTPGIVTRLPQRKGGAD